MASEQIVVWLDHAEACISRFDCAQIRHEVVKTYVADARSKKDATVRDPASAPATRRYFDDIADAVKDARGILIVGPGFERLELLIHLTIYFPQVAEKVVALEAVDHPNDAEMVPWAKKYFFSPGLAP